MWIALVGQHKAEFEGTAAVIEANADHSDVVELFVAFTQDATE